VNQDEIEKHLWNLVNQPRVNCLTSPRRYIIIFFARKTNRQALFLMRGLPEKTQLA
jgi:hypothetical protein